MQHGERNHLCADAMFSFSLQLLLLLQGMGACRLKSEL